MSIKICLLRTGETVIGNLKEVLDAAENKSLGYKIEHPYVIDYKYNSALKLGEDGVEGNTTEAEYAFRAWAPLSSEREYNFPHEFIDVIYSAHKVVEEAYNAIVTHYLEENTIKVEVDGSRTVTTKLLDIEKDIAVANKERELLEQGTENTEDW